MTNIKAIFKEQFDFLIKEYNCTIDIENLNKTNYILNYLNLTTGVEIDYEFREAYNSSNIISTNGKYTIRESLIMGQNGGLMMQSKWENEILEQ